VKVLKAELGGFIRRLAPVSPAPILWPPCVADSDIISSPCGFCYLYSFFFFPRLISAVADWMSTYFHTWCGLKAHSHRARLRPSTSVDARLRASTDVDARRRTYTRVYVRRRASRDGRGRRRARCEWAFSANLRCRSET